MKMRELNAYKSSYRKSDVLVQDFMGKVYLWMAAGLCATGAVSYLMLNSQTMLEFLIGQGMGPIFVLFLVELGLVFYLSSRIMTLSQSAARTLFLVYAVLNGVTLAPIFLIYTSESITSAFFVSAGMFGVMGAYGTMTKRDLSGWGDFLMMGLIGIIIASVVNLFMKSEMVMWVTTYIGVFVFLGLTAYDTQKLRTIARDNSISEDIRDNLSILGALTLYLDFLNLFLKMLRIMGKRR